jgi:hypothetical protein
MRWNHTVKIKHLFTENDDYASVQKSMNAIADILEGRECFTLFALSELKKIQENSERR